MPEDKEKNVRPIQWMGDTLDKVKGFPQEVRKDIGVALYDVQKGVTPPDAEFFKGVGKGVYEIKKRFNTNTYRTLYTVKIGTNIYALCAFIKKAKKGIKTPQKDIELIKSRYKQAVELEKANNASKKEK